jgi:hypothetical protein
MKQYKTICDVISVINVMIAEAPLPNKEKRQLADIAARLEQLPEAIATGHTIVASSGVYPQNRIRGV